MSNRYEVNFSERNDNGFFILMIVVIFVMAGGVSWLFNCDKSKLEISETEITLTTNEVYIISAKTYNKNEELKWKINDTNVAVIININEQQCKIQAVGTGTTTISVSSKDRKENCTINVINGQYRSHNAKVII